MKQSEIDKQRRCSQLLPPPGGEVVRALLDEIERLQVTEDTVVKTCQLQKLSAGDPFMVDGRLGVVIGETVNLYRPSGKLIRCMLLKPFYCYKNWDRLSLVQPVDLVGEYN